MSRKSRSGQSLCNDGWPERPQRAKEERAVAWLSPARGPARARTALDFRHDTSRSEQSESSLLDEQLLQR
jgi:hypothetical protein